MKKILTILLAVLYMTVATGATVHIHYCMGKLVEWKLLKAKPGECDKCGMTVCKSSCCKSESIVFKINTDHKASYAAFQYLQSAAAILPSYNNYSFLSIPSSVAEELPLAHAPPRSTGVPLFIQYCVYRI